MVNLISQISTHQESQRIKVTVYHLYIFFPAKTFSFLKMKQNFLQICKKSVDEYGHANSLMYGYISCLRVSFHCLPLNSVTTLGR